MKWSIYFVTVKEWGGKDGKPVLCLHGWMDNVNTFEPLVALLSSDYRFVSIDFSGHGLSSHRPFGSFYRMSEFCSDVVRIVEHLKLDKFHLMLHSLGCDVGFLYTGLYPERVDKMICLDTANLPAIELEEHLSFLAKGIQIGFQCERSRKMPPRTYPRQVALDALVKTGLSKVSAEVLLKRGSRLAEDGKDLVWNRDPRLHAQLFLTCGCDLVMFLVMRCKKDLLLFFASNSMYKMIQDPDGSCREAFAKNSNNYKLVLVEGTHHAHIDSPEQFAPHINEFL